VRKDQLKGLSKAFAKARAKSTARPRESRDLVTFYRDTPELDELISFFFDFELDRFGYSLN